MRGWKRALGWLLGSAWYSTVVLGWLSQGNSAKNSARRHYSGAFAAKRLAAHQSRGYLRRSQAWAGSTWCRIQVSGACQEQHGRLLISINHSVQGCARCLTFYRPFRSTQKRPTSSTEVPHSACLPVLVQPPRSPTSRRFSMLPWPSTINKLGKISATTHSPS